MSEQFDRLARDIEDKCLSFTDEGMIFDKVLCAELIEDFVTRHNAGKA